MKGRGSWLDSMLNKHLSYKHPHEFKEVVNIRAAGAASKCSAGNAIRILIRPRTIRIRPNSLKPLFGTPLPVTDLAHIAPHMFYVTGPSIWNSLPTTVQSQFSQFKQHLETIFSPPTSIVVTPPSALPHPSTTLCCMSFIVNVIFIFFCYYYHYHY